MPNYLQQGIPAGLTALFSYLSGGPTTQNGTNTTSSTTNPVYDPATGALRADLIKRYTDYLGQDPNLSGYTATGLRNINRTSDARRGNIAESLAQRGVSGPAAAYADIFADNSRLTQSTDFLNSIPLLQREMQRQTLGDASNFFGSLPYGQTQTANSTTTGVSQNPNDSGSGRLFETLAGLLSRPGSEGGIQDLVSKIVGNIGGGGNQALTAVTGGGPNELFKIPQFGDNFNLSRIQGLLKNPATTAATGGIAPAAVPGSAGQFGGAFGGFKAAGAGLKSAGGAIGQGLSSVASFMASNPWTLPVAAGIGAFIAYKKIGQGRKAANNFNAEVHDSFFKNDGSGFVNQIVDGFDRAFDAGQLTKESAIQARNSLIEVVNDYLTQAADFSAKGKNQEKVVTQNFANLRNIFGGAGINQLIDNMNAKIARLG